MERLNDIYKAGFFRHRFKMNWRAPVMVAAIRKHLKPKNVLDVGCATGDLVNEFWNWDIPAVGFEGSEAARPYFESRHIHVVDITVAQKGWGCFDLLLCLEVFEHIPEEFTDIMLDNLCSLSGRHLVSAAPPGQGGLHHVNCQPIGYWNEKYRARGFYPNPETVAAIRQELDPWKHKKGILAWHQNLAYYEKAR